MSSHCLKYGLTVLLTCIVICKGLKNSMESMGSEKSPVKVTAVFINCEIDDVQKYPDNEGTRFEREELFKHNALRNCDKKLALTIKLTSASANSADEYVPIEHVLDGSSKRRVRLLNPYVLRLRRDAPLEAYKLRFIETVSGILATSNGHKYYSELSKKAVDTEYSYGVEDWRTELVGMVEPRRAGYALRMSDAELSARLFTAGAHARDHRENEQFNKVAEKLAATPRFSPGTSRRPPLLVSIHSQHSNCSSRNAPITSSGRHVKISIAYPANRAKRHEKNVVIEEDDSLQNNRGSRAYSPETRFPKVSTANNDNGETSKNELITEENTEMDSTILNGIKSKPQLKTRNEDNDNIDGSGKNFALYEVETPMLWFDVHVHLFEKLTNLKGNTLWNDITKGVPIRLNSLTPEWSGPEINVHYKPYDVSREEFFLPKSSLCLLIPLLEESMDTISSNKHYAFDDSNFVLVPSEDVLDIDKIDMSKSSSSNFSAEDRNEGHRKVVVRVTRALSNIKGDKFNVVNQASDKFLTMRHRGMRHAQVDLEARADDNQLVHVSAPGRIAIIVADNTRGTRSMLTVQATNTGLFASQFRIQIRECDSDLTKLAGKQEGVMSEAEVLPPRHTRRLRLRLPDLPVDLQHCSVYLLNGNDESVAVRDAVIKKGDQCYCVWHCDCVCYGDNPRLPCREMSAARQDAAGLPLSQRRGARLSRACHYRDVTTINIVVVVIGVIGMLLFFGVLKGLLGLVWPRAGVWGLHWLLEAPRRLDCYYECALRDRVVVYDDAGCWPVHPDTRQRTVRLVSLPVEFILNVVFFVVSPSLIAVDTLKYLTHKTENKTEIKTELKTELETELKPELETKLKTESVTDLVPNCRNNVCRPKCPKSEKKFNSRYDVQVHHRRERRPRLPPPRWMTREADRLAATIWTKDATAIGLNNLISMFPLSHDIRPRPPIDPAHIFGSDSDLEDTAFVLMHMQKSTESLAKNQINTKIAGVSTDAKHNLPHLQQAGKADIDQA